jgi:exosortase
MNLTHMLSPSRNPQSPGGEGRWTLPANPADRNRLVLAVIGLLVIIYAYGVARTCALAAVPVSLVNWLFFYWGQGSDYAHGYVVPIVAGGLFVWKWKRTLHAIPMETTTWGVAVVVTALAIYWIGVRAINPRLVASSLVILIFGLILYLAGWRWAKESWFPCTFLFFMIPLSFLEPIVSFPLRLFVAQVSTTMLNMFGLEVYNDGTGIYSRLGRFEPLDVADPCSGIRSLVALMALTALYGYVTMDKSWKKWVLFSSSIPLAVLGNLARITTIALVAQGFGQDLAMHIYHDYSGYIVFSLAILCMIAIGALMNVHYRQLIHYWTKEEVEVPRPKPATGPRR